MDIPQLNILAVGREPAILQVVERLINSHEHWRAMIATRDEDAMEAFTRRHYPIVFVCAGVTAAEEEALRQRLAAIDPSVIVIRHYGGGSGLLENEVRAILDRQQIHITENIK